MSVVIVTMNSTKCYFLRLAIIFPTSKKSAQLEKHPVQITLNPVQK